MKRLALAIFFGLLTLLITPPEINYVTCKIINHTFESNCFTAIGIDVFPCWIKGIKLIHGNKQTNLESDRINWNQIQDEVDCYYLSITPNVLKYGDTPSLLELYPVLINIGMFVVIYIILSILS